MTRDEHTRTGASRAISQFSARQWVLIATPPVLTATMYTAYNGFVDLWGFEAGYLAAFLLYWVGWCLVLPAAVLGGPGALVELFREGTPRFGDRPRLTIPLLAWAPLVVFVVRFLPGVADETLRTLAVAVVIGVVIGVTEEVLWRGAYIRVFPESRWLGLVYPSVGFAVWHVAPLSVLSNPEFGGVYSFVLYSLVLGLSLGFYAWQTGSIRWATGVHVVHDFLGLPGATWLGILTTVFA